MRLALMIPLFVDKLAGSVDGFTSVTCVESCIVPPLFLIISWNSIVRTKVRILGAVSTQ